MIQRSDDVPLVERNAGWRKVLTELRARLFHGGQKPLERGQRPREVVVQDHEAPWLAEALLERRLHPVAIEPVPRDGVPQHDRIGVGLHVFDGRATKHARVEYSAVGVGTEQTIAMGQWANELLRLGNLGNRLGRIGDRSEREALLADVDELADLEVLAENVGADHHARALGIDSLL